MVLDTAVTQVVTDMATGTIAFVGSVVSNLWAYFLSLGVLAFAIGFVLKKTGIGRS